jgi:hypothetical protein
LTLIFYARKLQIKVYKHCTTVHCDYAYHYVLLFHVDNRSESSSTYDMIIARDLLGELGIIMNFNDHTVTCDTDTIPIKDRDRCTLSSLEALIEVYMSANEPQTLRDEYSRATKILDAE